MERSRISSWSLRHFPKWCTLQCLVLVLVVRLGHHDGWMIAILLCPTFPLMTSTLTCYQVRAALGLDALLRYFLFPPSCLFLAHSRRRWPEKTWENITRVFTRAEKAGQTNHLNLYCSTFLWQALYLYDVSTQYSRVHIFFLFRCASISQTHIGE